jgi:hypothetical protein
LYTNEEIKITFINTLRMREINSVQGYEDICLIKTVFDATRVVEISGQLVDHRRMVGRIA